MISPTLVGLATCPRCLLDEAVAEAPRLVREARAGTLRCLECGAEYPQAGDGYLDLRPPRAPGGRETRYAADEAEFAEALAYRTVGEPLLGAAVRNRWLRRWLPWGAGQLVLDVGCGDGRFALWNRDRGARVVGLDAAPLFADEALATVDLVLGDVRALPFPNASVDAAYSIDVMEHLDAPGLERFFAEVARVLKPGGAFYLYSNTRERSTLWPVVETWGRVSRWLRRRGIGDYRADDLRKSDHVKVLTTFEQVRGFAGYHGLRVERVRFWNGVFQGLVDNVLVRLGERLVARGSDERRATRDEPSEGRGDSRLRGVSGRQAISRRPAARLVLRALTGLMQLDVMLFGGLRSGPFFALLRKVEPGEAGRG
jgi:SAM-dependent methyltransferase